jgi:hypothetical protein
VPSLVLVPHRRPITCVVCHPSGRRCHLVAWLGALLLCELLLVLAMDSADRRVLVGTGGITIAHVITFSAAWTPHVWWRWIPSVVECSGLFRCEISPPEPIGRNATGTTGVTIVDCVMVVSHC